MHACVGESQALPAPTLAPAFQSNSYQDVSQASVMLVHGVGCFGQNWSDTPFYAPLDKQGNPTRSVRDVYLNASKGKRSSRNIIEYEYDQRLLNRHDPYPDKHPPFEPSRYSLLDLSRLTQGQSRALNFHYTPSWLTHVAARYAVGDRIKKKESRDGRPLEYRCGLLNPDYKTLDRDEKRDLFIHDNADASKYFNNTDLRLQIMNDFLSFVKQVHSKNGGRDVTIMASSHGSIVAYEALLLRAKDSIPHPEKLHLVMLGSPLDGGHWTTQIAGYRKEAMLLLDADFFQGKGSQAIGSVSALCGVRDDVCYSKAKTVTATEARELSDDLKQSVRKDSELLNVLPQERYTVTLGAHSIGSYAKDAIQ